MKRFIILILFLSTTAVAQSYFESCPQSVIKAIEHVKEHRQEYKQIFNQYNCPATFLLAIVLPEISAYGGLQDALESQSSEVFYTELGTEYSDFSLGFFQMKPSFVEDLENRVKKAEMTDYYQLTQFAAEHEKLIRKERLKRMKSLEWRTAYLCCFYQLLARENSNKSFYTEEERLRYFATRYNRGMRCSDAEIERWRKIAFFKNSEAEHPFIYAEVAVEFYNYLKHEIL